MGEINRISNFPEARARLVRSYYRIIESGISPLLFLGITPNAVSAFSLLLSAFSAILYSEGRFFFGGVFLALTGFLDTLDGTIARLTGKTTRFGALLDSTLDRYAEFFIFFGLLIYFRNTPVFFFALFALMGSMMVSYVKARGQSLGKTRSVGLMQRPERFFLLIAGSVLNAPLGFAFPQYPDIAMTATLAVLAVLSNITALRRLYECKKDLESSDG
ncbi:MAG TPA: CDP-alcohol phosphatidyltransferase family protein [Syntrophales bacterium]|nr:CDP-alcohol phosphatidyltransferase family protein [Syntrophales bacterium]